MQISEYNMVTIDRVRFLILSVLILLPCVSNAQGEKKFIRQGNREYEKNKYPESEISYRRAMDKNKVMPDAVFNVGNALYKQKKYEDAGKQFTENSSMNEDKTKKAAAFYNLGNSLLMANKLQESIDAYKSSLKLKPNSKEAKYNLAYAQDLMIKQQQQKQQQQQDKNKKDQNKDNNKDQNQNKDNKKDQDQKQDKQNQQNQQNNQQQQQQQPQQGQISKEDAERLLDAIANDEKNVQEKVKLAKVAKDKVSTLKNW